MAFLVEAEALLAQDLLVVQQARGLVVAPLEAQKQEELMDAFAFLVQVQAAGSVAEQKQEEFLDA